MHTLVVTACGLALLAVCLFIGRYVGGAEAMAHAALLFLPLWIAGAGINMWTGVARAGYSAREELPVLLFVFAVPAAVAMFAWWRIRSGL